MLLAHHLSKVKESVREYYQGSQAEANMLAQATGIVHNIGEKPDIVIAYEQVDRFKVLYWTGGLAQQPYIFMRELKIVEDERELARKLFGDNKGDPKHA